MPDEAGFGPVTVHDAANDPRHAGVVTTLPPRRVLLFAQGSPSAGGARGLSRGTFFNRDGQLVASAV